MKKVLLVLLAFTLIFAIAGCNNGSTSKGYPKGFPKFDGGGGGAAESPAFASNLSGLVLELTPNPYGDPDLVNDGKKLGYQSKYTDAKLMKGNQVVKGDKFTLEMKFTPDRDINDDLLIYLVDNTSGAKDNWGRLSCKSDADANRINAGELKEGISYEVTLTLKAVASASAATADANMLCFETKKESQQTSPGPGKNVKLNFTKFVFKRGDAEDPGAPPPPPTLTLKLTVDGTSVGDTTVWGWEAGDGPNGVAVTAAESLKGKLTAALSTKILGYTGGEARLFWKYVDGTTTTQQGIGKFGGKDINTNGSTSGTAVIGIDGLTLDGGELNLNTYNGCAVVKLEFWGQ